MQTCRYLVPINLLTRVILRIRPCVADSFAFQFSPSNFASMIRKMPLFLLSIIRRISLIVLKEFRFFCDFKILDVVSVVLAKYSSHLGSCHLSSRNMACITTHTTFNCCTRTYSNVVNYGSKNYNSTACFYVNHSEEIPL